MKMKAIIPCAGFGTRMNMKPNESKEMLTYNGFPIIDYVLELCEITNLEPIVIIRPEKRDLIEYLKYDKNVNPVVYSPAGEFAQTILDNKQHWGTHNILILPDTRFYNRINVIEDIKYKVRHDGELVFGVHNVKDPEKWGIITDISMSEKPEDPKGFHTAWGLIGFSKERGVEIFTKMIQPHVWHPLKNFSTITLEDFRDITRGE